MRRIETALRTAVQDLGGLGHGFAIVGGFAVSARAEPRTTKDVDFAVSVTGDHEAEQLAFELQNRGYQIEATVEQKATSRLATMRTLSPTGAVVDLLFASSGIEPEIVTAASPVELLEGLTVPVASLPHLIAIKVLARDDQRRPQDRIDLRALLQHATQTEVAEAKEALGLIVQRGTHRGRPLIREFEAVLTEFPPDL